MVVLLRMTIIGHRGARAVSPQNTLPSFKVALNARVPMIEFDTELTKDNQVIIFHDDKVDQITRGQAHGSINQLTFAEIQKLNVHDGFEDGNFYQVPALREIFDLVQQEWVNRYRPRLNIELKGANTAGPVAEIVKEYLAKGWRPADFIVSSFRHRELQKFKKLLPEIEIAVLLNERQWLMLLRRPLAAVKLAKRLNAGAINPSLSFINERLVKAAHDNNLEINVWTVNEPQDIWRMRDMGVDGICTDNPALAQTVLIQ